MLKKIKHLINIAIEYIEKKNNPMKKIPLKTSEGDDKLCPYFSQPCLGSECLAFLPIESEWDETVLREDPETHRVEDFVTGKRYKGTTASCKLGIFKNVILEKEEIKSNGKRKSLLDIT